MSSKFLLGLPGKVNTLLNRLTEQRAGYLDASITSRADPSDVQSSVDTSLNTATPGTPTSNSLFDRINELSDNYTPARATALDTASAADVWTYPGRTVSSFHSALEFLSDTIWIVPDDIYVCWVTMSGAGGGGGGGTSGGDHGHGGGSGEYVHEQMVKVTPGQNISITIGSGGSGGSVNADGFNGGDTIFGSTVSVTALGGKGGKNGNDTDGGEGGGLERISGIPNRTIGANGGKENDEGAWLLFPAGTRVGSAGSGGGGAFGPGGSSQFNDVGLPAPANSGGGGAGGYTSRVGGAGGSGRCIVRW